MELLPSYVREEDSFERLLFFSPYLVGEVESEEGGGGGGLIRNPGGQAMNSKRRRKVATPERLPKTGRRRWVGSRWTGLVCSRYLSRYLRRYLRRCRARVSRCHERPAADNGIPMYAVIVRLPMEPN